jgi:hypothetical protein
MSKDHHAKNRLLTAVLIVFSIVFISFTQKNIAPTTSSKFKRKKNNEMILFIYQKKKREYELNMNGVGWGLG